MAQRSTADQFFLGKRPWSRMKDQILERYLNPYLLKIRHLGEPIVLLDCYAGPGRFEEDGSEGSPLITTRVAESRAQGQYQAYFVNRSRKYHTQLERALEQYPAAHAVRGNAGDVLKLAEELERPSSLFVYLDPFGLPDFDFDIIKRVASRGQGKFSTEFLVNFNVQHLIRHSHRNKLLDGNRPTSQSEERHRNLDRILGTSSWRRIAFDADKSGEVLAEELVELYRGALESLLGFAVKCPVRERRNSQVKYYLLLASRHADAQLLMNDIMLDAYHSHFDVLERQGTLFEGLPDTDWKRSYRHQHRAQLTSAVVDALAEGRATRGELWRRIVAAHFMQFPQRDFRAAVKELVEAAGSGVVRCDGKGSGVMNDGVQLRLEQGVGR